MNKQAQIKLYAKALAEVIAKGKADISKEKIASNFVKLLISAGFEGKSKEILELAETMVLANQGKRKITFETARKSTSSQQKMLEKFVKSGDVVKEKINPELIAGIKIIINDSRQLDGSLQSKLQQIK